MRSKLREKFAFIPPATPRKGTEGNENNTLLQVD